MSQQQHNIQTQHTHTTNDSYIFTTIVCRDQTKTKRKTTKLIYLKMENKATKKKYIEKRNDAIFMSQFRVTGGIYLDGVVVYRRRRKVG